MTDKNNENSNTFLSENEVEYLRTADILQAFAKTLLEYPPIQEIPLNNSLQEYLLNISQVIGDLFPFKQKGIGNATVKDQVSILLYAMDSGSIGLESLGFDEFDCKLSAAVTAFLLQELAEEKKLPFTPECMVNEDSTHAIVGVTVHAPNESELPIHERPGTFYIIDFDVIEGQGLKPEEFTMKNRVIPFDEQKYVEQFNPTRTSDLQKGLELWDERYEWALQHPQSFEKQLLRTRSNS